MLKSCANVFGFSDRMSGVRDDMYDYFLEESDIYECFVVWNLDYCVNNVWNYGMGWS